MRVALISDIHANLEALESVLKDIESQQVDMIYCLGDVVGYGCDPIACLDLVKANCQLTLMGNHEWVALGRLSIDQLNDSAGVSILWTREQLTDRELAIISEFPLEATVNDALLVHASPFEPDAWHYILNNEAAAVAFDNSNHSICFYGHTHVPMIFSRSNVGHLRQRVGHDFMPDETARYLINVGSVGQPRDHDPRACYAVYDTSDGEQEVTYHRVAYDIRLTQSKMIKADVPTMLIERLAVGR